ncbi:putative membrane protein [Marinobacterium lacunae]|uniref:Putative membrane protein n=1 Tax=Marinobacterium lacunae TaxID=1232683 RepID=A0A081FTA5_9GAMM|nr:DUF2306 domain-containing protein [Marinobacterium lacunae]KEA61760.1 putative membrane protein [Marinobacterium lacunae]
MATYIHITAALWAILAGVSQLLGEKGSTFHRALGWTWMLAMTVTAISSFWLTGLMNLFWGYSPIHLLSLWVLVCVVVSVMSARAGNIKRHKAFAVGAFWGVIGAAIGTLMPGRLIHQWLFG